MNIALIGNAHLKNALERKGHIVNLYIDDHAESLDVTSLDTDLIIVHESLGMRHIPHGLDRTEKPTVFYGVDVHLNCFWQQEFAQLFDYVFVTQKDYVLKMGPHAHWLPWSIEPEIYFDYMRPREYDILFIGTVNDQRKKRRSIIHELQKRFRVEILGTDLSSRLSAQHSAMLYSRAKIILNESIHGEITFRTFEALACGGMLLTEKIDNGLTDLFSDKKEMVMFDYHDLIENAAYYLNNHQQRHAIAVRGKECVAREHTVDIRTKQMLDIIGRHGFVKRAKNKNILSSYAKTLYFTGVKFPRHRKRRFLRSKMLFKHLHASRSSDWESLFYLGCQSLEEDNIAVAKKYFTKMHGIGSADIRAYYTCAMIERMYGSPQQAKEYVSRILYLSHSDSEDIMVRIGESLAKQGLNFDAGAEYGQIMLMNALDCYLRAESPQGLLMAASIYRHNSLFDQESCLLEKAVELMPLDRTLRMKLGIAYLRSYKYDEAFSVLSQVDFDIEKVDTIPELNRQEKLILKGCILAKHNKISQAIETFSRIDSDIAYVNLTNLYLENNDYTKALLYCKKAARIRRNDLTIHSLLSMIYCRCGIAMSLNDLLKESRMPDGVSAGSFSVCGNAAC